MAGCRTLSDVSAQMLPDTLAGWPSTPRIVPIVLMIRAVLQRGTYVESLAAQSMRPS